MKVGLVSQEYPPLTAKGGIGTQTFLKARELAVLGHHVRVISRSPVDRRTEQKGDGIHVIRVPSTRMPVYTELADWLSHGQRIAEEIAAQHASDPFDIIDFPEWACEGYIHLLNQSEWNRIPTVLQLHGPLIMLAHTIGWPDMSSEFFRVGIEMEAATLRLADAVFSSSVCSADWCAKKYGLDREKIPVMHTGVDTGLFKPLPVMKALEPTILFVGKLVRNKGVEILVDAACNVADDFPNLRLTLVGGGEASVIESLRRKVAQRGLDRMLDIPGYVHRQNLPDLLSRAHVFAAPSRYEGGPGFVYLEAMACGLPVIGCLGSGAAEVIHDGENGLLTPPDDVPALTAALRRLLLERGERETMGENARKFVLKRAETKLCVAQIAEFYQQVAERVRSNMAQTVD